MHEVRITREQFDFSIFKSCIFFKEIGKITKKPHFQGIVYDQVTDQTIRLWLKNKRGLRGNEDFKVSKVKDEQKYLAYIAKDKDLVINTTDIKIEEYYDLWDHDLKKKPLKLVDKIFENFEGRKNPQELTTHCINYMLDNDKSINSFRIQEYVTTYLVKNNPLFKERFTQDIAEKIEKYFLAY